MKRRLEIVASQLNSYEDEQTIMRALRILRGRFLERDVFGTPDAVKDYLRLQAQGLTHEVFAVMYLDAHNRLIEYERMFRGTLTQTSVYPREVVKQALARNAGAVVLHHSVARHRMMLLCPDSLCAASARYGCPH